MPSDVLQARSALGVAAKSGDAHEIARARRNLAAAKLSAFIQKTISEAPPLTKEQRDKLSVLLNSGGGGC